MAHSANTHIPQREREGWVGERRGEEVWWRREEVRRCGGGERGGEDVWWRREEVRRGGGGERR